MGGLTWPWWPCCQTRGSAVPRLHLSPGATWQRWDDGSGRITVICSKTDVEAQGAVVAITPAAMQGPGRN